MKTSAAKRLTYVLTLFFLMACRTYACSMGSNFVYTKDLSPVECQSFLQSPDQGSTSGYTCSLKCPGIDGMYQLELYTAPAFSEMTYAQLQGQYCPVTSEPSSSSVPATSTPTATPSPTAPSTVIQPFLSGEVSACDLKQGFINFVQAKPRLDITDKNVVVTINGTDVKCSIAGNDRDLYSCTLPASTQFPAEIIVQLDGTQINDFKFDGSNCETVAPKPDGPQEPNGTPDNW
jgi:hypothetical protein